MGTPALNQPGRYRRRVLAALLPVALALISTGCAPHPHVAPKPPKGADILPASELLQRVQRGGRPEPTPAGCLTVEQAIQEALQRSPELHQIEQRIAASTEQVKQAEAAFYPRLLLAEDFSATDNPVYALMNIINQRRLAADTDFNNPGEQHNFSSRVEAQWSLFEGGSHAAGRNAAAAEKRAVQAELAAARNRLIAKTTETYYRWLQALGFIGVAERALEAASTDQQLGEARYQAQTALSSEVLRLKARTAEAHSNLVTARTGARRLQAGLERLMARPILPAEIPPPTLPVAAQPAGKTPAETDALVEQALDRRPEMAAVRALIEAAQKRVRGAQGGLLPRLGTSVQYQWDSEDLESSADSWMVGINATWALFEGGLTSAKIREAKSRLQEIQARGEQVALDIALEVQQATLAVQEAAEKIRVAEERRNFAQQALDEVRHLYRNQVVTVDSLLQAEVASNEAEVAHTAALFEGRIAQALLRQALGEFADSL